MKNDSTSDSTLSNVNISVAGSSNNTTKMKTDPRCKERQVRFTEERKVVWQYELQYFDMLALLCMIISVIGVTMNWKLCCWMSVMLSVVNISNFQAGNDGKQIVSSVVICSASVWMMYAKDWTPLYE